MSLASRVALACRDGSLLERGFTYGGLLLPIVLGLAVTPRALGTSVLGGERVPRLLLFTAY